MKKNHTGERHVTQTLNANTIEHLHRYALALDWVTGKTVLDIASGEGYGSNLMAQSAKSVIGVDISDKAIREASLKYKKDNLTFLAGSADSIPLESSSVDIVVSFETIEHHTKHTEMMQEIKRVLKKDGVLIISSPDKLNYTDLSGQRNPYHVKELYFEEFKTLLSNYFKHCKFYFQKLSFSSIVCPVEGKVDFFIDHKGDYSTIVTANGMANPIYNICIASDLPFTYNKLSLFNGDDVHHLLNLRIIEQVKKTYSYRIGDFILKPLKWLKKIIKKAKS